MKKNVMISSILCILMLILLPSCQKVSVPDTLLCTVAGIITAGADCTTDISEVHSTLTMEQYIDFLEPQPERPDPNHPSQTLPARGGAIATPSADFVKEKAAFEKACALLGNQCTTEMQQIIQRKALVVQTLIENNMRK